MKKLLALLLFAASALAQPYQPQPWLVDGATISYNNGGVTLGSVTGGSKGAGTLNGSIYDQGSRVATQSQISSYLPLAGGTMVGNLLFTDALYDIGASGATRPRNLYLSGNATIGGLTATRVPYSGTGGLLSDDSGFTYNSSTHTITVTAVVATLTGHASSDLSLSATAQTYSGGVRVTSFSIGTKSSGTYQVDCGNGSQQFLTNGGAFTLSAPANDGNCLVETINNASAGTITLSGFSPSACSGDTMTTANASKFVISVITINATSTCVIKALQ